MTFVYLASPYTPNAGESVEMRLHAACVCAARLMEQGLSVFSPIVHSHYIAEHLPEGRRMDHEFWMKQDLAILRHAERLIVLKLPGWEASRGIQREIEEATIHGIPTSYIEVEYLAEEPFGPVSPTGGIR